MSALSGVGMMFKSYFMDDVTRQVSTRNKKYGKEMRQLKLLQSTQRKEEINTQQPTHTHTCYHTLTHSHIHTHAPTHTLTLPLPHTHTHTHTHTLTLTHSHSYTLTLTHSLTHPGLVQQQPVPSRTESESRHLRLDPHSPCNLS